MEALNSLTNQNNKTIWSEAYYILTNILEPIIPHTCWEISHRIFNKENFNHTIKIDKSVFIVDNITLGVSINGKRRSEINININLSKDDILIQARKKASKWLENKTIVKEILVPNKLVNIVIK